jgi:hypothetical protein
MNIKLAPVVLVLASLSACSAQVDADHQGEALAAISGTVSSTRSAPVSDCEVTALWVNSSTSPDTWGANSVQVEGDFPSNFTLSIYEPPADDLLNDFGNEGTRFGVAYLVANAPGTDFDSDDVALLGADTEHLLVYVPEDVPAGSYASYRLHSTPTAGFHLYGVYRPTEEEVEARKTCIASLTSEGDQWYVDVYEKCGGYDSFDDFVPLESDLDTPLHIELVDDIEQLDFPNWT